MQILCWAFLIQFKVNRARLFWAASCRLAVASWQLHVARGMFGGWTASWQFNYQACRAKSISLDLDQTVRPSEAHPNPISNPKLHFHFCIVCSCVCLYLSLSLCLCFVRRRYHTIYLKRIAGHDFSQIAFGPQNTVGLTTGSNWITLPG